MKKKILIIGSGIGSLAAGCRLAASGHQVVIFEKMDQAGGRAYSYSLNGFKFDGGPSVITAPHLLDEVFEAAGKSRSDYFNLIPLKPFYRIFNRDGQSFNYSNNKEDILSQVQKISPQDTAGSEYLLDSIRGQAIPASNSVTHDLLTGLKNRFKKISENSSDDSSKSFYQFAAEAVENEFLREVFSFHPLLFGNNPFTTPRNILLNPALEQLTGVYYPQGGTEKIVQGLVKLFEESGGQIFYNSEVKEITLERNKAIGLRLLSGKIYQGDLIISNANSEYTDQNLVGNTGLFNRPTSATSPDQYTFSLFMIYFGTKIRYHQTNLSHHNIFINAPYEELIRNLFEKRQLSPNNFLMLHMPTITDATIAPMGSESFCVMSPVPNLGTKVDWDAISHQYRDQIFQVLEDSYLPDLRNNITAEHHVDPFYFQNMLNTPFGAAFAQQNTTLQVAGKFNPQSSKIKNLYYVGASTTPGAGLPAVLQSAKIISELIQKN